MPQGPIPVDVALSPGPPYVRAALNLDANGNLKTVSETVSTRAYLSESSGNEAATNAVATLPAAAGVTTYISGFTATASGATAASVVEITVAGVLGGTQTYIFTFPAGVAVAATPLSVVFNPALPASAADTAIVVTLPSGGSGNTNAAVVATGYQQ